MCLPVFCLAQTNISATSTKSAAIEASAAVAVNESLPVIVLPKTPSSVLKITPSDTAVKLRTFSLVTAPFESLMHSSTNLMRDQIIEIAKQYLGIRYVPGGQSEKGFDCSGFVSYVYSKLGIKIPRSSASQCAAGAKVTKDGTEVGDLVFFLTRGKSVISHVGIYIGDNKFIHSASSGKGVIISSLNEPYWKARFSRAATFLTNRE